MSLLKILKENNIRTSTEFKQDIQKKERAFGRWALILINDEDNALADVVTSLIDITKLKLKEAQAIALLAHFKGKAVITNGDGDHILRLAQQFEKRGIMVAVASVPEIGT